MGKRFTAATIDHLKPDPAKRIEIADEAVRGLYFVIQPSGARSWAFRYRHDGKPAKLTIGSYPALSLADARTAAKASRLAVDQGKDPAAEKSEIKQRKRDGAAAVGSVQRAYENFVKKHVEKVNKPRTQEETKRLFRTKVLPVWAARQMQDITRKDVRALIEGIEEAGTPIAANRTLAAIKTLFNWALGRDEIDANPCAGIRPVGKETKRDRVLTDEELVAFWRATAKAGEPFGHLMRILLLTGQRRNEVAGIKDSEIVGGVWTVPGERSKNGEPNDVPLSKLAVSILASVTRIGDQGWVFSTTGKTPVSGYSNAKEAIDKHMLAALKAAAVEAGGDPETVTLKDWTPHDLRRTLATGLARLGVLPHLIEAVLNHKSGEVSGVAEIYNRHRYLAEKRHALDLWAAHIDGLVTGNGLALNVVTLKGRRV